MGTGEGNDELLRIFRPDGASYNFCRGNPLDPAQTEVDPAIHRAVVERLEADYRDGKLSARSPSAHGAATRRSTSAAQRVEDTCDDRDISIEPKTGSLLSSPNIGRLLATT